MMFTNNRYKRIYDILCLRGQTRELSGYAETHHIIPRSFGGSDDPSNLVRLTAREHYVAHLCLMRCVEGPWRVKMCYAVLMMGVRNPHQANRVRINSRIYETAKRVMANDKRGRPGWNTGKVTPPETRERQRMAKLGTYLSAKHKERIAGGMTGKQNALGHQHSTDAKNAISCGMRGNHNSPGWPKGKPRKPVSLNIDSHEVAVFS